MIAGTPPLVTRACHGIATDVGRVRSGNEDAFGLDPDGGVFVVADGLGGHQAGEVASAVAVERFLGALREAGDLTEDERPRALREAVLAAHAAVVAAAVGRPERTEMGSTLVAAWLPGGTRMWVVNVGDSRCYLSRAGVLTQLSLDHTAVEELRRAGLLPDDRAAWPPRQIVTQALGLDGPIEPYVTQARTVPGDRVLLCSDGLTDMLDDGEIALILDRCPDPQEACDRLVQATGWRGALDNTTVLVVDVAGPEPTAPEGLP